MDLTSTGGSNRLSNNNQQEETHFTRLFQVILDSIINLKQLPERDIKIAIESVKKAFNYFTFVHVTKWDNLCAYLFRYASHGAGLTRCRVLEAIENCDSLALSLKKPDLKIVSLGGGPGNDIIGLCSALYECQDRRNLNLNMTVVDLVKEWSICVNLAKIFVTEGNFGNVSKLFHRNDINVSFLQVELPGNPTVNENYFRILSEADVILMTKLISILEWSIAKRLIKNLYKNVKKEAFILCIDSPFEDEFSKYFDVLYLSEEGIHYLSSSISERFNSDNKVKSKARIAVLRKRLLQ